jgi:signal transduction histidine kinase
LLLLMGDVFFTSLVLSAGLCAAFALHAWMLWAQTHNRQYLYLFGLASLEGAYCAVAHIYLGEVDSVRALPWGQAICAFTPFITFLFGQLVCSLAPRSRPWLATFQRINFWLTTAFALAATLDLCFGVELALHATLQTDLASAHRHRLGFTGFGLAYLSFVSASFTLFSILLVRAYRERHDLLPMVVGIVVYFACTVLDFGILVDLRDGYFVQHFGFFALVVVSWRVLAGRFERSLQELQSAVSRLKEERNQLITSAPMLQRQKLEGLGTLAAAIAHEINNPMQGILNYSALLRRSAASDGRDSSILDKLDREAERVARIVRSLLNFGRAYPEQPVNADLQELVQTVRTLTESGILRDGIDFQLEVAADLPQVKCNPQQLQQVLLNLITNARDAVNHRATPRSEEKRIVLEVQAFRRSGELWVRLSVSDTGDGVDPNLAERIFDPFFTTKSGAGGTGLGLSVSQGIMHAHGGELRLVAGHGAGAQFVAELPVGSCLQTQAA